MSKTIVRAGIIILILALLLECFLFNFRFWQSLFFKGIETGWHPVGMESAADEYYKVTDPESAAIEFTDINAHVDNIFVNIVRINGIDLGYPINVCITDAANALYYNLPDTEIISAITESKYIRVHLNGNSEKILIKFKGLQKGSVFEIESSLNAKRPFLFKWWRLLLTITAIGLIYLFRPGSFLYRIPFNLKRFRQLAFTLFFALAVIVLYVGIAKIFHVPGWQNDKTRMQYNYLAQSLLEGHAYLDIDPPASLETMEDPYDYQLRTIVLEEAGESYIIDCAYYQGKYYCYFGVVPALIFYIPYILLTGNVLDTAFPVLLMTILFIITAFWFVATLIEKYYQNTSLGAYILLSNVLIAGSALTYSVQYAVLYSLPITMGIAFDLMGITCWMRAVRNDGRISKAYLIIGSLFIALVIGCRPSLALALFFAFPIFWKPIKDRLFLSIKGIGNTCCVIIPFLIVGIGVMYYNYIRFGSPLDFGATYNLTGFDMTHRGIDVSRFGLGFFEYLFQPFAITTKFPFIEITSPHMKMITDYQGIVINEVFIGGFFAFNIFGVFLFRLVGQRNALKNKGIWGFTLLSLIIGLVIVVLDIQMVGIVFRYFLDFSVFLMMAALITTLSLMDNTDSETKKRYLKWIILLGMITIFVNYYSLLITGRYRSLVETNPLMYYRFKYQLFSFLSIR